MEFRRITNLPPYVFTIIDSLKIERRRAGEDVIDLGFGNPDIPSPQRAVEKLAEAVSYFSLTSADFVVDDPTKVADYGLDRPALSIEFKMEDASRTIIIAERQEGEQTTIYAMNKGEPAIVKVSGRLLEDLRKEPNDLRERSIADFENDDVVRVTAAGPDMSLVLDKVEGNWQITGEEP